MPRNPLQLLFPLAGAGAAPKPSGQHTCYAAAMQANLPQSQPMQRSVDSQESEDSDESDCSTSPRPSDEDSGFDSATTYSSSSKSPLLRHPPPGGLHSPLKAGDPALIRIAEILYESICPLDEWYFTPSPDEPGLLSDDYNHEQCSVLAIHSLVKRASLPVHTLILAALIIQRLTPEFYEEWIDVLSEYQPMYEEERPREIVVVAAIIIAQKFLHDAIYTLTTWSNIVCEHRIDLQNNNLHATERLILAHIQWRISMIADEDTIRDCVDNARDEAASAHYRYSKYIPEYEDSPPDEDY